MNEDEPKQLSTLVKENSEACIQMFKDIWPIDRLLAIANGGKPTIEEMELLHASLPIEWEELEELCKKIPNSQL